MSQRVPNHFIGGVTVSALVARETHQRVLSQVVSELGDRVIYRNFTYRRYACRVLGSAWFARNLWREDSYTELGVCWHEAAGSLR